jgi:hypothetical protein
LEVTNQSLSVLSVVLPHLGFARSRAPPLGYCARASASPLCIGLVRVAPQRQIRVWGTSASARWERVKMRQK